VEATCDGVIILLNGEVKPMRAWPTLRPQWMLSGAGQECTYDVTGDLKALRGVKAVEAATLPTGTSIESWRGGRRPPLDPLRVARQKNWPLRELRRDPRRSKRFFGELATMATIMTKKETNDERIVETSLGNCP